MASVIVPDNLVIGPGITIHVNSFIVGPLGSDWVWHLYIRPHGVETANPIECTALVDPIDQHHRSIQIGAPMSGGFGTSYSTQEGFNTGASVDAVVELTNAAGTVVEESGATDSLTWDTNVSSRALLDTTAGGGLTVEEAAQIDETHATVAPAFTTPDGTALPFASGELVVRPLQSLLGIDTTEHTLIGSGTLAIPSFAGLNTAWGLILDVIDPPPNSQIKPGYVNSFAYRVGQFLLLVPAANTAEAMVVEEYRLHLEHFTWTWQRNGVTAVAYYIAPGAAVLARWLQAFNP